MNIPNDASCLMNEEPYEEKIHHKILWGNWRFSDFWFIRSFSRLLCKFNLHMQLSWDGRPCGCMICGKGGHPIAKRQLGGAIRSAMEDCHSSAEEREGGYL